MERGLGDQKEIKRLLDTLSASKNFRRSTSHTSHKRKRGRRRKSSILASQEKKRKPTDAAAAS